MRATKWLAAAAMAGLIVWCSLLERANARALERLERLASTCEPVAPPSLITTYSPPPGAQMQAIARRVAELLTRREPLPPREVAVTSQPSTEVTAAPVEVEAAQRLLDDGLRRGRLEHQDIGELHRLLAAVDDDARREMLRQLSQAINHRQVVLAEPLL